MNMVNGQSRWISAGGGLILLIMAALLVVGVVLFVMGIKSFKAKKIVLAVISAVIGLVLIILPVLMVVNMGAFGKGAGSVFLPAANNNLINSAGELTIDVPEMTITYGYGLETPGLFEGIEWTKPDISYWHYADRGQTITINSNVLHPLDNLAKMVKISGTKKIKMSFPYSPSYYAVRYWTERYINDASSYEANFRTMEVEDGIITLPDEFSNDILLLPEATNSPDKRYGAGYIFEIRAVWEKLNGTAEDGYAVYSFFVTNNVLTK